MGGDAMPFRIPSKAGRSAVKALVTGASGFVGSHLVKRLLAEGVEVACLVRATSRRRWLEGLDVEMRLADLRDAPAPRLRGAVAGVDIVFHVAGLLRARTAAEYHEINERGTARLLEAARCACPNLRRFVYVSSLAAVGPTRGAEPLIESAPPRPISGYGTSKLAAERLVLVRGRRVPATVVRPPAVYGPRDTSFLSLFATAQRWGVAPLIGPPSKELTLVHVGDLVEMLWLAATRDAAEGGVYFVGGGTHTWAEVTGALEAALGRPLRRVRIPGAVARLIGEIGEIKWALSGRPQVVSRRKMRDLLQPRWTCSWAKAERELGYRPQVALAAGFRETAAWYAAQGWLRPLPGGGGLTTRGAPGMR